MLRTNGEKLRCMFTSLLSKADYSSGYKTSDQSCLSHIRFPLDKIIIYKAPQR